MLGVQVHRDVQPANLVWSDSVARWRLTGFERWARKGCDAPLSYTLRYAAPEVPILAHQLPLPLSRPHLACVPSLRGSFPGRCRLRAVPSSDCCQPVACKQCHRGIRAGVHGAPRW
jgi:hypothetical protein